MDCLQVLPQQQQGGTRRDPNDQCLGGVGTGKTRRRGGAGESARGEAARQQGREQSGANHGRRLGHHPK